MRALHLFPRGADAFCIEQLPRIYIERLEALDPIFAGQTPASTLWRNDRPCGTVSIVADAGTLRILSVRRGAHHEVPINLDVKLHRHRMPTGGIRRAFLCPWCVRRCRVLYLFRRTMCCRRCSGLRYWQQRVPTIDRGSNIAERYRKRLSLGPEASVETAKRPRHMKRATFDRIKGDILRLERRAFYRALTGFLRIF